MEIPASRDELLSWVNTILQKERRRLMTKEAIGRRIVLSLSVGMRMEVVRKLAEALLDEN